MVSNTDSEGTAARTGQGSDAGEKIILTVSSLRAQSNLKIKLIQTSF